MSKRSEYLCHSNIVRLIENSNFGLQALRLIHALFFFADEIPGCLANMAGLNGRIVHANASQVIALVGPVYANGISSVREGFAELNKSKLCDVLQWGEGSNLITYRFSRATALLAVRYKKDKFAMIDTEALQTCRTPHQILFYGSMKLNENADYPIIAIPGVNPVTSPWNTALQKKWYGAAQKWSIATGHAFLFVPTKERRTNRIVSVRVKFSHAKTAWSTGNIYIPTNVALPTAVYNGKLLKVNREMLIERRHWQKVDKP